MNGLTYHLPTSGEKAAVRASIQATKLGVVWWNPNIKFQCRVSGAFSTTDNVTEFAYYAGVGDYTDAMPEFTAWISAVGYGYSELGQCRVRDVDANKVYISMTSDIPWESGLYVTIVDTIYIWRKPCLPKDDGTILVDGVTAYSNQHTNPYPVINVGSHLVLRREVGFGVAIQLNAGDSTIASGSITAWQCIRVSGVSGNWSITNGTTATPTVIITADGQYMLRWRATSDQGRVSYAYRYIWVYSDTNPLTSGVKLPQPVRGQWGSDFSAVLNFVGSAAGLQKNTPVALVARDFHDGVEGSYGPYTNYSNVLAFGWLGNENIQQNIENGGVVRLDVKGPAHWLSKGDGADVSYKFVSGTPSSWGEVKNQTTAKGIKFFIQEHTNLNAVCDVYVQDDGLYNDDVKASKGSLWGQLVAMAAKDLMTPTFDQWGRLIIEKNANQIPIADRGNIPQVMSLDKGDFENPLEFGRVTSAETSQIDLVGLAVNSSGVPTSYFALAPGRTPKRHGVDRNVDNILVSGQVDANSKAGLLLGDANNPLRAIPTTFLYNNRFFSTAPQMYATLTLAAADNLRGVGYIGYAIPRAIEYDHDDASDTLVVSVEWEGYVGAEVATIGANPEEPIDPDPPDPPLPPDPPPPDPQPPLGEIPVRAVIVRTANGVFWTPGDDVYGFNAAAPIWFDMTGVVKSLVGFENGNYIGQISADRYGSIIYARSAKYLFSRMLDPQDLSADQGLQWWKKNTWLVEQVNDTDAGFTDISTNPATGEVFVIAGSTNVFNRRKYTFRGVDGGDLEKTALTELGIFDSAHAILSDGKVHVGASSIYAGFYSYYSPDDGENWQDPTHPVGTPAPQGHIKTHQVGSSQTFYALEYPGLLLKTTDGGENWALVYTFDDWRVGPFGASPDGVCLCWKAGGLLLRSTDGGSTWSTALNTDNPALISPPAYAACTYLFPLGGGIWIGVWARFDTNIYVSFDNGSTWEYRHGNGITGAPLEFEVLL